MSGSGAGRNRVGCRPILEDKWALVVVNSLATEARRFTELKRSIEGISQRMLTVTLRNLERDGILIRTVHNVMPPNISYELTPLGATFLDAARPMMAWADANVERVEKARAEYDQTEISDEPAAGRRPQPGPGAAAESARRSC